MAKQHSSVLPIEKFPFTPETYPGRRPRFSFLFTSRGIYRCSLRSLAQLLEARRLPPIHERYPVLAYGSNACPSQLLRKCRQESRLTHVPVLFGRLIGAHAVYANRCTQSGYIPATVARKAGASPSWLTLLTGEQVVAMDHTEGRPASYVLAGVPRLRFTIGQTQISPLYSYVDVCAGVMVVRGRPVSLRSVGQRRARSIVQPTTRGTPEAWLDFIEIPFPHLPQSHAEILRTPRGRRGATTGTSRT
jgi:hypothetical protein